MTLEEAERETVRLFGEDSFTEEEDGRYYVGALPTVPGPYQGFMGFSWEEALKFADHSMSNGIDISKLRWTKSKGAHVEW